MRSLCVWEAHVRHSSALVDVTSWRASSVRSEEAFGRLEDSFWRRGSSQWRKWRLLYPKGLSISGKTGIAVTWNEEFTRKILKILTFSFFFKHKFPSMQNMSSKQLELFLKFYQKLVVLSYTMFSPNQQKVFFTCCDWLKLNSGCCLRYKR